MNVHLTPHDAPRRTDTYGGIERVKSNGRVLILEGRGVTAWVPLALVAVIAVDEDGGGIE